MSLTNSGKKVRVVVLENLQILAEAKLAQAKRDLERMFNEHATESTGRRGQIQVGGTSQEIRAKYHDSIETMVYWKRYNEVIQDLLGE